MTNLKILITGPPRIGKTTIIKKITQFLKENIPYEDFIQRKLKKKGSDWGLNWLH